MNNFKPISFDLYTLPETNFVGYESIKVRILSPIAGTGEIHRWVENAYEIFMSAWNNEFTGRVVSYEDKKQVVINMLKENAATVPLEALTITSYIEGVSRQTMAQWTRHRRLGFGVMSHRINDARKMDVRMPPDIVKNEFLSSEYKRVCLEAKKVYADMIDGGIPVEQARCILGMGSLTYITTTGTLGAWLDVLRARTDKSAQDEIQVVANKHIEEIKNELPVLYDILKEGGKL